MVGRAIPLASYRKVNTMRELSQDEQRQVAGGNERGNTGANNTAPNTGKQLPNSNNNDCGKPA